LYQSVCEAAINGGYFITAAIFLRKSETEFHAVAGAGADYEIIRQQRAETTAATREGGDWPVRRSASEGRSFQTISRPTLDWNAGGRSRSRVEYMPVPRYPSGAANPT
jgi:hypothetical protein